MFNVVSAEANMCAHFRGSHLSNTTRLTHLLFKTGD